MNGAIDVLQQELEHREQHWNGLVTKYSAEIDRATRLQSEIDRAAQAMEEIRTAIRHLRETEERHLVRSHADS